MRCRPGFTLVELLVVMTIVTLLASMVMFAMYGAQQSAREAATRARIQRLDDILTMRFDSYRTRRVPINTRGMAPKDAALARLEALRQLMRLEMPQTWAEVTAPPTAKQNPAVTGDDTPIRRPSISEGYLRFYNNLPEPPSAKFQNAECLYLIVTMGVQDDGMGREAFNEGEIGDVDGDGAPEFLDAWGTPIRFLRWAPGFTSDRQQPDPVNHPDPFDPHRVDPDAYALYPLIYSAGPDRIFDIRSDTDPPRTAPVDDPFADADTRSFGEPANLDSYFKGPAANHPELNHHDNIHNHGTPATLR